MGKIDSQWEPAIKHRGLSSVLFDDLEGRVVPEGGDTGIHTADSLCGTAETNSTL